MDVETGTFQWFTGMWWKSQLETRLSRTHQESFLFLIWRSVLCYSILDKYSSGVSVTDINTQQLIYSEDLTRFLSLHLFLLKLREKPS